MNGMKLWLASGAALLALAGGVAQAAVKVHVNQVALERAGPKAAVVETDRGAAGGRFSVLRDGQEVLAGDLAAEPAFSEWGAGKRYFTADFSGLKEAGRYEVKVTLGGETATSPAFVVADDALFATTGKALVEYFKLSRNVSEADKRIRIYGTKTYVNVWGGWKDAGGDAGKYLSHLSYANFFNPQQTSFAAWALARSYEASPGRFQKAGLDKQIVDEALWGADYLHRLLSPEGFFYMTVFDRWKSPGAERVVTGYVGIEGVYTKNYQAAYREGGGVAIAALARAYRLAKDTGAKGEFPADQYLADAERSFAHMQKNNLRYVDDGRENIIDDYTALLAATELYLSTKKPVYLEAARARAARLNGRMTANGWFDSDDKGRPYYHAAEAGFPVLSLVSYLAIETDAARIAAAKDTIGKALKGQLTLDAAVANPYDYPRQPFMTFKDGRRGPLQTGFFIPHANETRYWWQGESARLASLSVAALLGGRATDPRAGAAFGVEPALAEFAQDQIDWTLGRNPYDMSMLYGFGAKNVPDAESAGVHVPGGISNGITGGVGSDQGRGIAWAEGPDSENWRWLEQWIPHNAWFLLLASVTDPEAK
ncbi:glycoside hydrolase family 9 protein [Caulobacter mirabilis]|uniref:Glycosyl hydrolase n=1 Tax=Caulobacter mirabilis TaxID=69666 RepID=A0A2D2B0S1_9CAUL|nr:glycoside hydrolase family 9 protein [Caulobacter mirabilis]ATQ43844.1 glycosyl hydrolase [Caulobacter mirabilis]